MCLVPMALSNMQERICNDLFLIRESLDNIFDVD
jgi:hypothetical protein